MPLDALVFFVRSGKAVPLALEDGGKMQFVGDGSSYVLYSDDGESREVALEPNLREVRR